MKILKLINIKIKLSLLKNSIKIIVNHLSKENLYKLLILKNKLFIIMQKNFLISKKKEK